MFLAVLDQTIVATALPSIAAATGEVERASWIVVSYLIASTIAAPIYGRLGDSFGRRRLMFVALAVFIVASVLCAASTIDRAADARPGAPGPRRRRADDAVPGAGRRGVPAARAGALPGLSRRGRGVREHVRPGGRRLSHRAFRLAVGVPDQRAGRALGGAGSPASSRTGFRTSRAGGRTRPGCCCSPCS